MADEKTYVFDGASNNIPLAYALKIPFVPIRKPGKLPGKVVSVEYGKEYGKDVLQMQATALSRGARVIIIDDLLATGGSMNGAIKLVRDNFDAKVVYISLAISYGSNEQHSCFLRCLYASSKVTEAPKIFELEDFFLSNLWK